MKKSTAGNKSTVTYSETENEITVHIRGAIRENLKKIADTMNGVSWCDNDNTATGILDTFIIGYWLRQLETPTGKVGNVPACGIGEATENIAEGIYTGFEDGTPEDETRKDELRTAFELAGL